MRRAERDRLYASDAILAALHGRGGIDEQVGGMLLSDGVSYLRQIRKFLAGFGKG